ncbi:DUF5994 family protein [Actinokineospora diospyrosa]|uniref:Uncharacterized protein n=1 Tax=Actinokineospora diospyrosa TaxID=103728 RepID=A0ABT1IEQ5_9PSEU|nr:DUF5994 family protein [Actinokineospora diospyrosa]MCP2271119.1 hypothetical protein [Actinokineospora diospyrosa]
MTPNQSSTTTDPTTGPRSRWSRKPPDGALGSVDGAWWPRSTDPAAEFPPLIAELAASGIPVRRVFYNPDAWDRGEHTLTVRDVVVRMEGVRTTDPHTVTVIGPDHVRTRLLVIPPATPGGAARAALRAAEVASTATAADILEWNNVATPAGRAGAPRRRTGRTAVTTTPRGGFDGAARPRAGPPETGDEERWETDDGQARTPLFALRAG